MKFKIKQIIQYISYGIGTVIVIGMLYFFIKSTFFNWAITNEWIGSYYRDIDNTNSIKDSKGFGTYEECAKWGDELKSKNPEDTNSGYSCGQDCEYTDESIVSGVRVKTYECANLKYSNEKDEEVAEYKEFKTKKGDYVRLYQPQENDTISDSLEVIGQVKGSWSFEGSFPLEIVDAKDNSLAWSTATLQSDWQTEDYVLFVASLYLKSEPQTDYGYLIISNDNASGLPENNDLVKIKINFER